MQLSQTAEYALRGVVWLAENVGNPQTAQQIADGCKMPAGYLTKVLQPLAKAGVVSAQRGLGGGYVLERDPAGLSMLEVISAVEPMHRIRACPLKIGAHGSKLCALHRALDEALAMVEQSLGASTIGALLDRDAAIRPLCGTGSTLSWTGSTLSGTVSTGVTVGISNKREGSASGEKAET